MVLLTQPQDALWGSSSGLVINGAGVTLDELVLVRHGVISNMVTDMPTWDTEFSYSRTACM